MRPACPKLWWQRMIIWLTSHSRADTHKNLACLSPLPSPLSLFPAWPRPGAGDRNHQAGRDRDLHSHVRAAGGQGVQDVRLHHARPLRKVQVGGAGLSWRAYAAVVCSCLNEARLDRRRLRDCLFDLAAAWSSRAGCELVLAGESWDATRGKFYVQIVGPSAVVVWPGLLACCTWGSRSPAAGAQQHIRPIFV